MNNSEITNAALTRLLVAHACSLPVYLEHAPPWSAPGQEGAIDVLRGIIADHHGMEQRLGRMILDRRGKADPSDFPTRYADFNDLSLDYLWGILIQDRRHAVDLIRANIPDAESDPKAHALAQEALGMAVGHLQNLTENVPNGKNA